MSGNYVPPTYLVTDGHGHVLGWLVCTCGGYGKEGTNPECPVCRLEDPYETPEERAARELEEAK